MSFIADIAAAAAARNNTEPAVTDKRNELKTSFWGSKRFLLMIGFGAFIVVMYAVMNIELIRIVGNVLMVYIAGETLSNCVTSAGNAYVKAHEVKADVEYTKLSTKDSLQRP